LSGRQVKYPPTNPSPPNSEIRAGLGGVELFVKAMSELNVSID
jgi:hypothetical protein